jgi:hypothetical protein
MQQLDEGRPGDRRGFVHKKLIGVATSFIPGPVGTIARTAAGSIFGEKERRQNGAAFVRPPARGTISRTLTARSGRASAEEKQMGRQLKFGPEPQRTSIFDRAKRVLGFNGQEPEPSGCVLPFRRDPGTGKCKIFLGERAGPDGGAPVGDAVMGRYGAALQPGIRTVDRAVCLPGMQLGNDGLCYNKGAISNKQRMWPAGRKPLLTGGEMRAISVAASAAKKVEGATKRLQTLAC